MKLFGKPATLTELYPYVRVWAFYKGHPIFTWEQFENILPLYEAHAMINN